MSVATPSVSMQGVASPDVVVDPTNFYAATRRLTYPMRAATPIAGLGSSDSTQLRQTGIVAGLYVRVYGTLVFGGTITGTTMSNRWPYNLAKALRVSANGQSNLINCNGLYLKALEYAANNDLNDRGVARTMGATAVTQGSLSLANEDWGTSGANQLGPGVTVAAIGTYTVDFTLFVPIAADQVSLIGSIFAQTAATNLTCDIDWETQANLVTLGGAATLATPALNYQIQGLVYSIPVVNNRAVVPDLSQFHQVAMYRTSAIGQGDNELLLPGTGVGRKLLRVGFQTYSGTAPGAPLAMTSANYGPLGWRYGGNDTPEQVANGQQLRVINERTTSCDMGRFWGIGMWDFASQFALRDVVDEGATSDLRLLMNLVNAPTTGYTEVMQETLFSAPVGA